jgi:DNA-binding MurR/RpiR family transcriptional regulator
MKTYIERIRESRLGLSPSFERLADFLLDSYAHAALLTATEIGHTLDIDTATVVRFAQFLGYKGYPELQREMRNKLRDELLAEKRMEPDSSAEAVEAALSELAHGLDLTRRSFSVEHAEALISALDEAQRVIILGEGLAFAPARNLAAWLEGAGYNIHLAGGSLSDLARALASARKGDMVVVIEVDEETPYLSGAITEAKGAGITSWRHIKPNNLEQGKSSLRL